MAAPILGIPEVDDIYQCSFRADLHDEIVRMVLHYRLRAVGPTIDADRWDFYSTIHGKLNAAGGLIEKLLACSSQDIDYNHVRIQLVRPTRKVYRQFQIDLIGDQANGCHAVNVAMAITKRTSFPAPDGVGTLHLGGLPTAWMDGGRWDAALTGTAITFANALDDEINDAGGAYELVPCLGGRIGSLVLPYYITSVAVQPEVRTMYRRTKGIGE